MPWADGIQHGKKEGYHSHLSDILHSKDFREVKVLIRPSVLV